MVKGMLYMHLAARNRAGRPPRLSASSLVAIQGCLDKSESLGVFRVGVKATTSPGFALLEEHFACPPRKFLHLVRRKAAGHVRQMNPRIT